MSILLTAEIDGLWFGSAPDSQYYQSTAAALASGIQGKFAQGSVLVAGCGHGHLVNQLVARGYNAWGCDASQYAVDRAKVVYPSIATRFLLGDCRVQSQMASVRQQALGGPTSRRFDIIVADDLDSAQGSLAVLSQGWLDNHPEASGLGVTIHTPETIAAGDAEVGQCRTALLGIRANNGALVHTISMLTPGNDPMYHGPGLWHLPTEWRAMFPDDPIYKIPELVEIP